MSWKYIFRGNQFFKRPSASLFNIFFVFIYKVTNKMASPDPTDPKRRMFFDSLIDKYKEQITSATRKNMSYADTRGISVEKLESEIHYLEQINKILADALQKMYWAEK